MSPSLKFMWSSSPSARVFTVEVRRAVTVPSAVCTMLRSPDFAVATETGCGRLGSPPPNLVAPALPLPPLLLPPLSPPKLPGSVDVVEDDEGQKCHASRPITTAAAMARGIAYRRHQGRALSNFVAVGSAMVLLSFLVLRWSRDFHPTCGVTCFEM